METVEPIRSREKILQIKVRLKGEKSPRNYLLFTMGLNLGARISDILNLKVKDVTKSSSYIWIREGKTNKEKKFTINKAAREALDYFMRKEKPFDPEQWLFASRKGTKLDRTRVWFLIKKWCEDVGVKERIGAHSLRKSFGYHARKQGVSLEVLQQKFNHSSPKVTARYIGITQEEVEAVENSVCL